MTAAGRAGTQQVLRLAFAATFGLWRLVEFELDIHEVQELVPAVKVEVVGQGTQVIEEGRADAQMGAYLSIDRVTEVEDGVYQEGEAVPDPPL